MNNYFASFCPALVNHLTTQNYNIVLKAYSIVPCLWFSWFNLAWVTLQHYNARHCFLPRWQQIFLL